MAILPNLAAENDALKARIAELEAKATNARTIKLKVGEKGTVCLYYGSRYPIPLYASQWETVIPFIKSGAVEAFIAENAKLIARLPA